MIGAERGAERATGGSAWTRARAAARPLVIGHRGASAQALENTLPAFERAARDGADGVELDVLCCATGEVVVFHDDNLSRLAGRTRKVGEMPWSALRAVALPGGHRIPLLDQAFEACGPSMLVNVELKSEGVFDRRLPQLVEGVSRSLDRCGTASRVLISSFNPLAVALWQRRRPEVATGLLFESGGWSALAKTLTLPLVAPTAAHPEVALCTRDRVARLHQVGYRVNTWTEDDPDRLRALAAMGVDGIISNDPAAARRALAAR